MLNCGGYFDLLLRFIDHVVAEGFLQDAYRALLSVEEDPQALIEALMRRTAAANPR